VSSVLPLIRFYLIFSLTPSKHIHTNIHHQYFNIEQQKEEKREKKICKNASAHMQKTAQRFTDEEALLQACFYNLDDDVLESERRAARMYDRCDLVGEVQ
jgi:hypothetical protein